MSERSLATESSSHHGKAAGHEQAESRFAAALREEVRIQVETSLREFLAPVEELIRKQDPTSKLEEFREWMKTLTRIVDGLVESTRNELPRYEEEVLLLRQTEQSLRRDVEVLRRANATEALMNYADLKAKHSRILQTAIVEQNKGSHGSSTGPQHDTILRKFESVKTQIEGLIQNMLTRQKREGMERRRAAADLKATLTECLLVRLQTDSDPRAEGEAFLGRSTVASYRKLFDSEELLRALNEFVDVLRAMSSVEPRGLLLVPERDERFDPNRHQVPRGYVEHGAILRIVFPGYVVDANNPRVLLKADVLTESEGKP